MIDFITLDVVASEDGGFIFVITPSIAFSSPEKFRWELTFGQGGFHRGVITFKAGETASRSIPQSIDPDEHYQIRVYRVSDHNNEADDELLFQQQSQTFPPTLPPTIKGAQSHSAAQRAGVEGDQGTEITQVNAALVLNKNEATVIDATALLYRHPTDPNTELTYTLTADPVGGELFRDGVKLGNGDSFTQSDIDDGLITYRFTATDNNPTNITFTVSSPDGPLTLSGQTLQITPREDVDVQNPEEDNTIDRSGETAPQKIDTGDGSDTITGGPGDDQIDAGAGDDEITLTRDDNGSQVDAGADEVLYTFGYGGDGTDGGDVIKGFRRGQDKLKFVVNSDRTDITTLTAFLQSLEGADGEALTDDDAFIVTMMWGFDEDGVFYFDGVLLHFKDASVFGSGPLSSPVVSITFDERLGFDDLVEILGGAENVADNFDGGLAAFKNLDEVLPRLFGENSIAFEVLPVDKVLIIDGPVIGAEVFFDLNDDGEVTDAEKDVQRDESGRSRYLTDEDGTVDIPERYVGLAFVADVDGAYDTSSGERLEGAFRSLDDGEGGIATPITDLIVTYLEEVEGQAGAPTTEQEVLDAVFGAQMITLRDILDARNYEIPADTSTPENNKKDLISRAAIALTEIKENDGLADGDGDGSTTKAEIASMVATLLDTPEASSVAGLKLAVDIRVDEAGIVKRGKPIATPAGVDSIENTDYEFPNTPAELIELFGFLDPGGNRAGALSSFVGVFIRINIENASLKLDDNTLIDENTSLSDSMDSIPGYVYVPFERLDELKLSPAVDFNGPLKLVFRVWDGQTISSNTELMINVVGVNDAPEVVEAVGDHAVNRGEEIDIELVGLFTDPEGDPITLTVTLEDGSPLSDIGLTYIPSRDQLGQLTSGRITGTITVADTYTIKIVATDDAGAESVASTFDIVIAPDSTPIIEGIHEGSVTANNSLLGAASGVISITYADGTNPGTPPRIMLEGANGLSLLKGTYGTMSFSGKSWTYTLDNDDPDTLALISSIDGIEESFVFIADGADSFTVTITVYKNPPPVIKSVGEDEDNDVMLTAGDDETVTGALTVIDADETDFSNLPPIMLKDGVATKDPEKDPMTVELKGTYGTMTFTPIAGSLPGGTWSYALDNDDPDTLALGLNETRQDIFTFTARDARNFKIAVTVTGVEDAPQINGDVNDLIVRTGENVSIDLRDLFTDPEGNTVTLTAMVVQDNGIRAGLDTINLTFSEVLDPATGKFTTREITGSASATGKYTIEITASDGTMKDDGRGGKIPTTTTTTFTIDVRDILPMVRYFDEAGSHSSGWYMVAQDGTSRTGAEIENLGSVEFNTALRVIIDENTPPSDTADHDTLITNARGDDEYFIMADAASVIIHDPWGGNSIIFDARVKIISIAEVSVERAREFGHGQDLEREEPGALIDYVITLDSGESITIWDVFAPTSASGSEPRYEFLHLHDDASGFKTVREFFNAYKNGFYPDLTKTVIEVTGGIDPRSGFATNGELTVEDPDVPENLLPPIVVDGDDGDGSIRGTYGTLTLRRSGDDLSKFNWNYVQDNSSPVTQRLREGKMEADVFILTAGDSDKFVVSVTVFGKNDNPVFNPDFGDRTGVVGQTLSIGLSTFARDFDGDALNLRVNFLDETGNELPSDHGLAYDHATQSINGTPTIVGTYLVEVRAFDGPRGVNFFNIEVTARPIEGDNAGTVTEDDPHASTVMGELMLPGLTIALEGADGDGNLKGTYGTMNFDPDDGRWTYTLDNGDEDTNALKNTPGVDEFFFIAAGARDKVTITVSGANDAPMLTNTTLSKGGTMGQMITPITAEELMSLFNDPDSGDEVSLSVRVSDSDGRTVNIGLSYDDPATPGQITGRPTMIGTYTIEVTATDKSLAESQSARFTFEVGAQEITGTASASVTEDDPSKESATGTLTAGVEITLDGADHLGEAAGTYGTMVFDPDDGRWTYTLDNNDPDTQALGAPKPEEESVTETFSFTAGDATFDVTITVRGANDIPVESTAIEEQRGTAGQKIVINLANLFIDPDGDEVSLSFTVMFGGRDVTDTVSHTYDAGKTLLSITPGEAGIYTIKTTATDSNGASSDASTFDIVATVQEISGTDAGAVVEDDVTKNLAMGTLTAGSTITLDGADNLGNLRGIYGVMAFDGAVWTYALDNNDPDTQALGEPKRGDDPVTETFSFTAGAGARAATFEVTITVTGVNDAPVAAATIENQSARVTEELASPINLSSLFTDPDGDELILSFVVTKPGSTDLLALEYIGLGYDPVTKTITGTPTRSGIFSIEVIATDRTDSSGASATSTFTITIAPDRLPEIRDVDDSTASMGVGKVMEDGALTAQGALAITDADGEPTQPIMLDGADKNTGLRVGLYGQMAFSDGVWVYTLDNNSEVVQALGVGDSLIDRFSFTAVGARPFEVVITVSGANDAPVASAVPLIDQNLRSGATLTTITLDALKALFTDDDGDDLDITVEFFQADGTTEAEIGLAYSEATGIIGTLNNDLSAGDYKVTITADDGTATAKRTFTITVAEAPNQTPVLAPNSEIDNQMGTVGQMITPISMSDLRALFDDPDDDDALLVLSVSFLDSEGELLNRDIGLTYDPINGITGTLTAAGTYMIEVTATDKGNATVTFTFNIMVVSQIIIGDDAGSVFEDGRDPQTSPTIARGEVKVIDGVPASIDLAGDDDNDGLVEGLYGDMRFNAAEKTWLYRLDNTRDTTDALGDEAVTETFTFTADKASFAVTITVNGVNDAPRITGAPIPPQVWKAGEEIVDIDLSGLFTDPEGDELTVTVTLDNGGALEEIGLSYDPQTGRISGALNHRASGSYVIKIVATDSNEKVFRMNVDVEIRSSDAIIGFVGQEIDLISLSLNFSDGSGTLLTVSVEFLDDLGRIVDFGLVYIETLDDEGRGLILDGQILGTLTKTGTYMIRVVSTNSETGMVYEDFITFVVEEVNPPTLTFKTAQDLSVADFTATEDITTAIQSKVIFIDDLDALIDSPQESSRNQVGISAGAQGGSAADVAAARANFKLDYDDADVRILAVLINTPDTAEEKHIVEGKYGRFILRRELGDDTLIGAPAELIYYYEPYQRGEVLPNGEVLEDHKNYRNINALKKDEKAYDVLTIWATDRLISGEEPQAVIDRRVVKTVVAEVTGVNDAPEVISKTPDVLFTEGGAAVDIAIDPANFFDVDGDELIITVTLDDGSALSLLELTYDDPITPGRIIGTPKTAGTHIIKVTATDPHGGEASYSFNLSNIGSDVETRPVVEISGTANEILKRVPIASGTDTGFDLTYMDADDAYLENDEVVYEFYLLGANGGKRLIDYFSVDPEGNIIFRIENRFTSDLAFEVVAIDGEGSESVPQHFTIITAAHPVPSIRLVGRVEEQEVSENVVGGNTRFYQLIVEDDDTEAGDFNPSSFTITGEQADKFTVQKADDRWYLFLKLGESLDHEALDDGAVNLQITVSDGINTSSAVEAIINVIDALELENPPVITGEDQGFYVEPNGGRQIVYQTIAESDGVDTEEIYSLENGGDNDLFEINERGEVRFKPEAVPPFDTAASFEITIIVHDPNDNSAEKGVTIYSNSPSDISGAVPLGQPNTDSPSDQALGYTIGPDDVPTDADGVVSIDYYWFTDNRPYSGSKTQIGLQKLVDGEVKDSRGDFLTPLAGENERFLTLKGEHAEKIIWLVLVITDGDGRTIYHFWAVSSGGRYDIADSFDGALALADIGIEGAGGTLEMVGHLSRNNDEDFISFTVEAGETLTINLGLTDAQPDGQENQSRAADYRILNADGTEFEAQKSLAEGEQDRFVVSDAGHYILEVSQNDSSGFYKIGFEGLNDKPTDLVLTDHVTDLASDVDLSVGRKVGVLTITDDIYGTNTIVLTGADAELFEIRETSGRDRLVKELWLKAGVDLGAPGEVIEVIASVEGTGEGSNPDDVPLSISVTASGGETGEDSGPSGQSLSSARDLPDVASLTKVLGEGVDNASVGTAADTFGQFLLGGDLAQTLNAGVGGDVIFGGKGGDTINLGTGADTVVYRYDDAQDGALAAHDGGDVVNNFDLDEDTLILVHAGDDVHDNAAAFIGAIKGVGLLVNETGNITGVVFTFIGRGDEDQDIELVVNFNEDDFVSLEQSDLSAFDDAALGRRSVIPAFEATAYQVIDAVFGDGLQLINFEDIGFELNSGETDII